MGRIILLILLFISFVSLGQTNSAKYVRDADTAQMIIQTTKSGGIVKYLLITGTDTAQIRWDGTALLIEGYNIVDSTNLQTDTLKDHRVQINKNMDSLALHLDTLQVHITGINLRALIANTGRTITFTGVNSDRTLITLSANEVIYSVEIITDSDWGNLAAPIVIFDGNNLFSSVIKASSFLAKIPSSSEGNTTLGGAVTTTCSDWGTGTITIILTIKDIS